MIFPLEQLIKFKDNITRLPVRPAVVRISFLGLMTRR